MAETHNASSRELVERSVRQFKRITVIAFRSGSQVAKWYSTEPYRLTCTPRGALFISLR